MTPSLQFQGLCLITTNVPRLVEFYTRLFGTVAEGDAIHSTMDLGGQRVAFWNPGATPDAPTPEIDRGRKQCFALMFKTDDVDRAYARALAEKMVIQEPIKQQPWGVRVFVLNDPDGNRLHLLQPAA